MLLFLLWFSLLFLSFLLSFLLLFLLLRHYLRYSHLHVFIPPSPFVLGETCEIDAKNECEGVRCENGGRCKDHPGNYVCECPSKWNGRRCTEWDPSFKGGPGREMEPQQPGGSEFWTKCTMKTKAGKNCVDVFRNKICDPECNVDEVRIVLIVVVCVD